jgi:hypothetical protein
MEIVARISQHESVIGTTWKAHLLPLFELVEVVHSEVADTNTPDLTFFDCLHQRLPGTQSALRPMVGCVEQVQINVLQLRLLQTLVDAPLGVLVVDAFWRNLGSVEQLFAWDAGSQHAFGCGLFVTVDVRAVHMAVARLDCMARYIFRYICWAAS